MNSAFAKLLFVAALLNSSVANGMDIATYERGRRASPDSAEDLLLRTHIAGVAEGYNWANAQLEREKKPLLFCAPIGLALNSNNYLRVLDEAIAENRESWLQLKMPVGGILLFALRSKLPCAIK